MQRLGVKKALVVHSSGLDELTPMGPADVVEVTQLGERRGASWWARANAKWVAGDRRRHVGPMPTRLAAGKRSYALDPKDLGIPRCEVADLAGGDAALNARILLVCHRSSTGRV